MKITLPAGIVAPDKDNTTAPATYLIVDDTTNTAVAHCGVSSTTDTLIANLNS